MKYTFSAKNPANHFLSVKVECSVENLDEIIVQLPAWRPGRYELGNFAKNVKDFIVYDAKRNRLCASKLSKDSWEVECKTATSISIEYDYYATELNAGATWLDENQMYVNPVNCCVYVLGKENDECEIQLDIPKDYKVASSMTETGKNTFSVENSQELADSPFIASSTLQHKMYESNAVKFHIWFQGKIKPDPIAIGWDKLIADFQKFTDYQIEKFGAFPVKEYHFLNQITTYPSYHGVEHQKSTVIQLGPSYKVFGKFYTEFLGVSSHELYHTWNIKAIRPQEMFPYDFSKENYSKLGYIAEGVTTYMGDRVLYECGVFDVKQYFKEFENYLTRHFHNDGRKHYSVANSSWDTWLDGYVQGVPGRKTSIYTEGALIAYICDMRIRKVTQNEFSLHTVMRELYNLTNRKTGYTENDYRTLLEEVLGVPEIWGAPKNSFADIFKDLIHGTADFTPYLKEALSVENWLFEEKTSDKEFENYGIKGVWKDHSFEITNVMEGSSSEKSGLIVKDKIHSINGIRINNDLSDWLIYFNNDSISLSFERKNTLKKIELQSKNDTGYKVYKLALKED